MLDRWKRWFHDIPRDALALCLALFDRTVPLPAKLAVVASILYVLLPVDLIPDFLPVVGFLDDLAVLPLAGWLARRFIRPELLLNLRWRADTILRRVRPKVVKGAVIVIVVWMLAASYVGWRLWRERQAQMAAPAARILEQNR